ncbi:MAG TPA: discoidin domain-containing protein, partial [Cyclobacteriaceae bacterium]|nr:discoidin domain-containing protein [Cyclobacteriaceae bacterium]
FYHAKEDSLVKSPEKLFEIYLTSVGRGSTLLLNIPPDRRGLIHENDVLALQQWRALLDETFKTNLAGDARVTASAYRGNSETFSPVNLTDSNPETCWATDDDTIVTSVELEFPEPREIRYVLLQEYIKLGQRVKAFDIAMWNDDKWKIIAGGTTIGYKRIIKIDPVKTNRVRITIRDAKACPVISNVEIY